MSRKITEILDSVSQAWLIVRFSKKNDVKTLDKLNSGDKSALKYQELHYWT